MSTTTPLTPAQQRLVSDNLGLAYTFGPRFAFGRLRHDEAVSVALEALTRAAAGYRHGSPAKFSSYATTAIRNNVWREVQRQAALPVPVGEFHPGATVLRSLRLVEEPNAEQVAAGKAMLSAVMAAAQDVLTPRNFDMFRRHYLRGESLSSLARAYGVYPNAVRYALRKGKQLILAELSRRGLWLDLQRALGEAA